MGGGDLNMKKSWHPHLRVNQERVWKEEKRVLEEKKKLAQLQKERAEERQLQELQRLQAEQGGHKREERVDWLYAAPAAGGGPSTEELEAYLLGKKRVDQLFREKDADAAQIAAQSSASAEGKPGGGFVSLQNANSSRDTAAKIREDPLLAIRKQEQAAYEKMLKDPVRRKALRDGKRKHQERDDRSTEPSREDGRQQAKRDKKRSHSDRDTERHKHRRSETREDRRRSRSRDGGHHRDRRDVEPQRSPRRRFGSPPPSEDRRPRPRHDHPQSHSTSKGMTTERSSAGGSAQMASDKAARLAAMTASAASLSTARVHRLAEIQAEDEAAAEREAAQRQDSKGDAGKARFIRKHEQAAFGGMGLAERMKRTGGVGMVRERD